MRHLTAAGAVALVLASISFSTSAQAGVELVAINIASGETKVLAGADLDNSPGPLFYMREVLLLDRCGSVYECKVKDQTPKIAPWPERRGVKQILQGLVSQPAERSVGSGMLGVFDDGIPRAVSFDQLRSDSPFSGENRALEIPDLTIESPIRFAVSEARGRHLWLIDEDGSLWWAKHLAASEEEASREPRLELHRAGQAGAWKGTVAFALESEHQDIYEPSLRTFETTIVLYTIDADGHAYRARLGSYRGRNTSIRPDPSIAPERIGDRTYPGTVALFAKTSGTRRSTNWQLGSDGKPREDRFRIDASGRIFKVDFVTGEEEALSQCQGLAHPAGFCTYEYTDEFGGTYDLLYVREVGETSYPPCPDRRAMLAEAKAQAEAEAKTTAERESAAATQAATQKAAALASWNRLQDLYEAYRPAFEQHEKNQKDRLSAAMGNYKMLMSDKDSIVASLGLFERDHLEPMRDALTQHVSAHGKDEYQFQGHVRHYGLIGSVEESFEKHAGFRRSYASSLTHWSDIALDRAKSHIKAMEIDPSKAKLSEGRELAAIALEYEANDEKAKSLLSQFDASAASLDKTIGEKIQQVRWPSHFTRFAGPGDVEALAAEAIEFTNRTQGTDFFDAYLVDDWRRNQRNALGEVMDYLLYFKMIRRDPDDPALGILSKVSLVTDRAQKSSPYRRAFVDDVGRIPLDKRPEGAPPVIAGAPPAGSGSGSGGAGVGGSGDTSTEGGMGFFGWTFLLLSLGGIGYGAYLLRLPENRTRALTEIRSRVERLRAARSVGSS